MDHVPTPGLVPQDPQRLFDRFIDGELEANDPRLDNLPQHLREQIDRIVAEEAAHNEAFAVVDQSRQQVLREAGRAYDGDVRIGLVYGQQPSVLAITGVSSTDTPWFYRHLFGIADPNLQGTGDPNVQAEEERAHPWVGARNTHRGSLDCAVL